MKNTFIKFSTLIVGLFLSLNASSQAQIFFQDFTGATDAIPVNVYNGITNATFVSTISPSSSQFTSIIAGKQSSSTLDINSTSAGEMAITSNGTSFLWCATRSVDLDTPAPTAVMIEMRSKHDITSTGSAGKFTILVGSGLVDDPATAAPVKPAAGNVHSGFMMAYRNSTSGGQIYDYAGSTAINSDNMTAQENTYFIWRFVVNNTGSEITYTAPDGSSETLPNDTWDLWFDNTKWINDSPATTGTQGIGQFKIGDLSTAGRANWNIDYVKVFDYSNFGLPKLPTPNVTAATTITTTSFTANWDAVAGATGYICNIYNGATLANTFTVGAGVLAQNVSGLTSNTTYTVKVIAIGDGVVNQNSAESTGVTAKTISTEKAITAFTLLGANGTINEGTKTISVVVPFSTVLPGSYTPTTVTVSNYATCLTTGPQTFNFVAPTTTYTVQAEDGSTQNYAVTLTKAPASPACSITNFSTGFAKEKVDINQATGAISVIVDDGEIINNITPIITKSDLSSISPTGAQNFTPPLTVTYTVTAEDISFQKTYTVTITKDGDGPVLQSSNPEDDPAFSNEVVSLAGMITLTYNEDVYAGAGAVSISGTGTLGVGSIVGKTVQIPFSGLTSLTNYTLTIPAGVFTDYFGNPVAAKSIRFRTADAVLRTFPYASHMDGASFAQPAFISGANYDINADSKATTTTQYGAYVLAPGQILTITAEKIGTILANVYAPGENRSFTITNNQNATVTNTPNISSYDNNGVEITQPINSNVVTSVYITNTSATGNIYIPYIYISDVNQPAVPEKEMWCK